MRTIGHIRQFLSNGQLGPIRPGLSATEIRSVLGEPERVGGGSRRHRGPCVWRYGDVELGFASPDGALYYISIADWSGKDRHAEGWGELVFNSGAIRGGMSRASFIKEVAALGIAWVPLTDSDSEAMYVGTTA